MGSLNCIGKAIIVQLDDGWHIFIPVAESEIWMGCLNRKKWRLIHITMLISYIFTFIGRKKGAGSIIPVLPVSVFREKNLYVGTFPPFGQAK